MAILKHAYRFTVTSMIRNPSGTAGVIVFGLGFALVAGNAIYSQPQVHPDPFWMTTDQTVTRSLVENAVVAKKPISITRSVLTQRISLKNIPVPTSRPTVRSTSIIQSELVRETQDALYRLKLYDGKVDGIYGSATKDAITQFQTSAGILPDGSASYELLNQLNATNSAASRIEASKPLPAPKPIIQTAVSIQQPRAVDFDRDMVLRLQTGLKEKFGVSDIELDGVFGSQTQNALRRFQTFFELNPTGEIDARTLEKLLSAGIIQAI
ncbi:MAG: peptidoglycan-binding domain-containing protein [Pseudomonadota bacterium]